MIIRRAPVSQPTLSSAVLVSHIHFQVGPVLPDGLRVRQTRIGWILPKFALVPFCLLLTVWTQSLECMPSVGAGVLYDDFPVPVPMQPFVPRAHRSSSACPLTVCGLRTENPFYVCVSE